MASGALSLSENYVLTREASGHYLDDLTPEAVIFFSRPEFQIPRLVSTAREVVAEQGVGSISDHVLAFSNFKRRNRPPSRFRFLAGLMLKKSAFRPEELAQIRGILNAGAGPEEDSARVKILFAPDQSQPHSLCARIAGAAQLEDVFRASDSQLAPATDDKPFFNQHTRWSRIRWSTIVDLFSQSQPSGARLALEDRPIAEVTLLILLGQSAIVAGLCILLPPALLERRGLDRKSTRLNSSHGYR